MSENSFFNSVANYWHGHSEENRTDNRVSSQRLKDKQKIIQDQNYSN